MLSEEYTNLAQEVIEEHEDLQWLLSGAVTIGYMSSDKKKKSQGFDIFGECKKVTYPYTEICPFDFLIILYDQNLQGLSYEQMKILMYHELLHIGIDERSGEPKYVIVPHDVQDFRAVIEKYGIDWARKEE